MVKKKKVTLVKTKKDGSVKFKKDGGAKSKQVSVKKAEKKEKKGKGFVAKGNDAFILGISPGKMSGKGKSAKLTPEQNFARAFSSGDISTNQINEAMGGKKKITGKSGTDYVSVSNKSSATSPSQMSGSAYDNKMAYNKNLKPSARLHYLENERHDKTSGSSMSKHMGGRKGK